MPNTYNLRKRKISDSENEPEIQPCDQTFLQKVQIDYTTDGEDMLEESRKCAGTYDYHQFYKIFKDLIGGDCWALTVNDEIIFNSIDKNRPIREYICDDMIRTALIDVPHKLFVHLFRAHREASVCVYIYEHDSFVYHIRFVPLPDDECKFIVKCHYSKTLES